MGYGRGTALRVKPDAARLFAAENARWAESQFLMIPEFARESIRRDYERTLKRVNGVYWANTNLRDTANSDAVKKAREGRAHYDNDEIISSAKIKADNAARAIEKAAADAPSEFKLLAAQVAACNAVLAANLQIPKTKTEVGLINRVKCVTWWRSALRKQQAQACDQLKRENGEVKAGGEIYCADVTVERRRQNVMKMNAFMEAFTLMNELGYQATLKTLADKTVANPEIRRLELMTRIRGLEEHAKKIGYVGEFWTITAPSSYHRFRADGRRNRNWNKSTPREVNDYVSRVWARIRASLKRADISYFGIRVVEPHHDGCPHWHMLAFLPAEDVSRAREIVTRYALEESPDEEGAKKHRCQLVGIDSSRGSATGYVAKYISKSINGSGVSEDLYGTPAQSAAERIQAWASCWRIRQFQFFGSPPVTIWRELRKFDEKLIDLDEALENLRIACDLGQFDKYFELQLLHCAKLITEQSEDLNRYGEQKAPDVIGIALESNGVFVDAIRHEWRVVNIDAARMCGAWSSVNNCTGSENGSNREKLKRKISSNTERDYRTKSPPAVSGERPKKESRKNH